MMLEKCMTNKFFEAAKVDDGTFRITGMGRENCYLVEGKERALLIDGLSGVGPLKAFVRELTELPVIMAATHGHLDHIGAAWEYDEVFLHPDDIALMYTERHSSREARLNFVNIFVSFGLKLRTAPTLADTLAAHAVKTYPVYEGDRFDLGGREIEVIAVPGHTCGTVVFLDRERRVLFSGDACNANTLLNLEESASVEEYLESLKHLKLFQKDFDVMYGGHDMTAIPNSIIDDGIALCERILAGRDDAVPMEDPFGGSSFLAAERGENYLPKCGGNCNIVYKKDRLYRRVRPSITGVPNCYR